MINYRKIDLNTYAHRAHLEYFLGMQYPQLCLTAEVDVTDLKAFCKNKGYSFFLTFLHVVALAADEVPELRQRLHRLTPEEMQMPEHAGAPKEGVLEGIEIREYDQSPTSHTEASSNGLYCYCPLAHHMPWEEYIANATRQQQIARTSGTLEEDEGIEGFYFATCIPWIKYTEIVHPMTDKYDSNPRFSWGKFGEDYRGRLMMPLTIAAHHGLIDGRQIGKFYENVDKNIKALVEVC